MMANYQNLLNDQALANRLAQGGRAAIEKHYDRRTVYTAWDEVHAE
jgi:hypothetical protein